MLVWMTKWSQITSGGKVCAVLLIWAARSERALLAIFSIWAVDFCHCGANARLWAWRQSLTGRLKTDCAGGSPTEIWCICKDETFSELDDVVESCRRWTMDELFYTLHLYLGEAVWLRVACGLNAVADAPVTQERVEFIGCELGAAIWPKLAMHTCTEREERPDSVDDLAGTRCFCSESENRGVTEHNNRRGGGIPLIH